MNTYLNAIKNSFLRSLSTDPRSNEKLKILHGYIAKDLNSKLGDEYTIKSLGYASGKENKIQGRYLDKNVDITIIHNNKTIAGIAVKFVMSNYSQNSNNYFENMMGETANIRAKNVPYFQIFILADKIPYYKKDGTIKKWELVTENNLSKYIKMSGDNIDSFFHTPNKTLFTLVSFGNFIGDEPSNSSEYKNYYLNTNFIVEYSNQKISFKNQTIYNDYEEFIDKVYYYIKSI